MTGLQLCCFIPFANACLSAHTYWEVHVTQCLHGCEKDRQGGRGGHQREETVGSASSFIAALMSPGTHRLETAVLFSPPPRSTNPIQLPTHRNMYIQRATQRRARISAYIVKPHRHTVGLFNRYHSKLNACMKHLPDLFCSIMARITKVERFPPF